MAGALLLIEGPSGIGKSSLALALIDRGAVLIGDDGVELAVERRRPAARQSPAPHCRADRGPQSRPADLADRAARIPVALVLRLDPAGPALYRAARNRRTGWRDSCPWSGPVARSAPAAMKAELALERYGLT
jgi:hypothetical protein